MFEAHTTWQMMSSVSLSSMHETMVMAVYIQSISMVLLVLKVLMHLHLHPGRKVVRSTACFHVI